MSNRPIELLRLYNLTIILMNGKFYLPVSANDSTLYLRPLHIKLVDMKAST